MLCVVLCVCVVCYVLCVLLFVMCCVLYVVYFVFCCVYVLCVVCRVLCVVLKHSSREGHFSEFEFVLVRICNTELFLKTVSNREIDVKSTM